MTTNQENYAERYARIAHLATDSMKSFHTYLKAETDDFTAWGNLPMDTVQTPLVGQFKQVDRLIDKVVVEPGYSGNKFEGKDYRSTANLSITEVAKLIRQELAIEFPGCKFSVYQNNGSMSSSINVKVLAVDFDPISDQLRRALNAGESYAEFTRQNRGYGSISDTEYSAAYQKFAKKAKSIQQRYNFNDSNAQVDYFHVRYYGHVQDLNIPDYLANETDPNRAANLAENERQQRIKDEAEREKRKATNLEKYGDHKKGDWAYYIPNVDSKYGYFKKGDLLPCKILTVPNGRARYGSKFAVRVYLAASSPIMVRNRREGRLEPAFGYNIVEYTTLDVFDPKQLQGLPKAAPIQPAKPAAPKVAPKSAPAPPAVQAGSLSTDGVTIVHNTAKNGIEVKFSAIPDEKTRTWLKAAGYRWSKFSGLWYVTYTPAAFSAIQQQFGTEATPGDWSQTAASVTPAGKAAAPAKNDQAALAAKFIKTADSLQAEADKKSREAGSANRNTPKRNREANSKQIDADIAADKARYYRAIGQAILAGNLPRSLAQISPAQSANDLRLFIAYQANGGGYYDAYRAGYPQYQEEFINRKLRALPHYFEIVASELGWNNYEDVDKAYADLQALAGGGSTVDPEKIKLNKLIDKWRFANEKGFFPTPAPLCDRLVKLADIQPGMSVLEPSAGLGDLAEAVLRAQPSVKVDVVEQFVSLAEILALKGFNVVGSDFMQFDGKTYDRIVMNPPFENGQDAKHIRHAYDLLKPGGRLVAIAGAGIFFRSDKVVKGFREWLDEVDSETADLPVDSFKTAFRPTGVLTRLVIINKPGQPDSSIALRARVLLLVQRQRLRL